MKTPLSYTASEQKANLLWDQFSRRDQESFWKKYEPLVTTHKASRSASTPTKIMTPLPDEVNNPVFSPSSGNYFQITFIVFFLIMFFATFVDQYHQGEALPTMLVPFLGIIVYKLWRLNTFYIHEQYLTISKRVFSVKRRINWEDIKSITIEKRRIKNETYRVLVINTYPRGTIIYKFPVSRADQQDFVDLLEAKGVQITDESASKGFWESLFG